MARKNPAKTKRMKTGTAGVTRREVLKAGAGALALGGLGPFVRRSAAQILPSASGKVEHIVLVMMENRSFDHFLGWVPGANGKQAGLTYVDRAGASHDTHRLSLYQNCDHPDPDHSQQGGLDQWNGGACDGFLRSGSNDEFSIGYYEADQLDFYRQVIPQFTTLDNYFTAVMSSTFPNRVYQHAGRTDRLTNSLTISTLPTIWDAAAAAGVSATYYFNDLPAIGLFGPDKMQYARPYHQFLVDAAAGTLPAISYIDPDFGATKEGPGISRDDHPHADIRDGQAFLDQIYTAIAAGPLAASTVLVINYDEWGGFYDHVAPDFARDDHGNVLRAVTGIEGGNGVDDQLRGFRVPCLVISPWTRSASSPRIHGGLFDHCSAIKMMGTQFGLDLTPLGPRVQYANDLSAVLGEYDPRPWPQILVPQGQFAIPCAEGNAPDDQSEEDWRALSDKLLRDGWPL